MGRKILSTISCFGEGKMRSEKLEEKFFVAEECATQISFFYNLN
jgi:hypothetical protein